MAPCCTHPLYHPNERQVERDDGRAQRRPCCAAAAAAAAAAVRLPPSSTPSTATAALAAADAARVRLANRGWEVVGPVLHVMRRAGRGALVSSNWVCESMFGLHTDTQQYCCAAMRATDL